MRSKYTHLPECQRPCLRRCQDPVAQTEIGMSQKSLLYLLPRPRTIAALGHMQHDDSTKNITIVLDSIKRIAEEGERDHRYLVRERERERENIEVPIPDPCPDLCRFTSASPAAKADIC